MPEALYNKILEQRAQLLAIKVHMNNFYNDMYDLAGQLTSEGCPNSGQSVLNACVHLWDWIFQLSNGTDNYRYAETDTLLWINDNWPTDGVEYELTMSKIMTAMWDAQPYQCLLFIPMIDAMRGAIQEKTVTVEWMGNALRHFL